MVGSLPGRRPARGRDRPRLYVSFGTVLGHMTIAADVYRTALLALTRLDADVLLTVGRQFDPADLGPLPPHVRVERWVEQTEVLDDVDAVVCHGGSGTLFGALGAGVPVVVVPVFADQFENGRRVARAGAGLVVERPEVGRSSGRTTRPGSLRRSTRCSVTRATGSPQGGSVTRWRRPRAPASSSRSWRGAVAGRDRPQGLVRTIMSAVARRVVSV